MNPPNLSISARIRLAMLKGVFRLLAWAIAPALSAARRPAPASAPNTANAHRAADKGDIIDGEYRRIDTRHNDRW